MGRHRRSGAHAVFLAAIGLGGWAAIAGAAGAAHWPSLAEAQSAALFAIVIAGARALAFPLGRGAGADATVSLDSAIFVAATACLGAGPTALAVGVLLAID